MIATGTDIKPLEIVMFMRAVKGVHLTKQSARVSFIGD